MVAIVLGDTADLISRKGTLAGFQNARGENCLVSFAEKCEAQFKATEEGVKRAQVYVVLLKEAITALIFRIVVRVVWISVYVSADRQDIWDRHLSDEFQYFPSKIKDPKKRGFIGGIRLAAIYTWLPRSQYN